MLVAGSVLMFPTVSTVSYSDPPCAVTMQIRLVDPDGRVVQDLWSGKSLTVEVLLDGPGGTTTEAAAPPEVVPVYHNVHVVPTTHAFLIGRADIRGIGLTHCNLLCPHQVPTGAVPVRIEVQLSCEPLEAALDEDGGCLECSDAKRLLGLLPDAEVRSHGPHTVLHRLWRAIFNVCVPWVCT